MGSQYAINAIIANIYSASSISITSYGGMEEWGSEQCSHFDANSISLSFMNFQLELCSIRPNKSRLKYRDKQRSLVRYTVRVDYGNDFHICPSQCRSNDGNISPP